MKTKAELIAELKNLNIPVVGGEKVKKKDILAALTKVVTAGVAPEVRPAYVKAATKVFYVD
jgi:hypothetical protein